MAGKLNDETLRWTLEVNGDQGQKELANLEAEARKLTDANKSLRLEMQKLEAAGKKNTQEYKSLQQQIKANSTDLATNKARTEEVTDQMGLSALTLRQLRTRYREVKTQMDNTRPNTPEWKKLNTELKALEERIGQVSAGTRKTNSIFGSLKSLLPALGIGALVSGLVTIAKGFFNLAKEMEQFDKKARIVFGDNMPKLTAAAAENAKQLGLTRNEYIRAAANVADLLVPLGFNRDIAADLSVKLTNLSGALDEWSGGTLGAAQVNEILTKAMLGEAEQLKQLGIVIDQSSKEYTNRIELLQKTEGVTREQARALDILNQIQTKSVDAQTAFAQEGENLLRTQKSIATWWRQMKENVVEYFTVPVSEKISREKDSLNLLVNSIISVNDNQEVRNGLIEEIQRSYPGFLGNLDAEKVTNEQLRDRLNEVNQEYDKKIKYQVYQEELLAIEEKSLNNQRLINNHVKNINFLYDKYVKNKKDNATLEEKALALRDQELDRQEMELGGYLDIWEAEKQIRLQGESALEQFNLLQGEKIKLEQEYTQILTEQSKYKPVGGEGTGGGGKKTVQDDDTKKRLEKEKKFRQQLIFESKTLVDQENLLYEERLKNAGLYGKKMEQMTNEELEALYLLNADHERKLKDINDKAFSEKFEDQKDLFDKITLERQIAHQKEMAALGNNEAAKKQAEEIYQKQELERQHRFLEKMISELQEVLAGEDVFQGLDENMLSDEQKETLLKRIDELRLALKKLKEQKDAVGSSEDKDKPSFGAGASEIGTDIFGMSPDDWVQLIDHIRTGNLTLEDTIQIVGALTEAWAMYSQIRSNLENQAMMDYESQVNRKKNLLEKQLKNGLISQESYTEQIAALDDDLDKKKRELAIKQAKREKATALMGAIVNTALAVVKALQTQPVWLGIVMAALVGLMGGLQIATIASEPIPQYARGRYDVIGAQDGKTYNAGVISNARTGILTQPTILAGEKPEIIIDTATTRKLMLNRPDVIQAIMANRVPQYAAGRYPQSMSEVIKEKDLPAEFYNVLNNLSDKVDKLTDRLNKGIGAKLVADGDYITTHNDVMDDYDTLRNQVDLRD